MSTQTDQVSRTEVNPGEARTGAELLVEVLREESVRFVFGNPGTTEMPLVSALAAASEIEYVLGLQETSVVAMAAGYATASGRPGFVNLHTAGGLGHAMGAIIHAQVTGTPLVVTAGQQDTRHLVADPLLSGDLVGIATPVVKWAREVGRPEDVPVLLRRALRDSATDPCGPVFLSLPIDVLQAEAAGGADGGSSRIERLAPAPSLDELADLLSAVIPGRLAILAGDEVATFAAQSALVAVAECLGAPVFASSWPGRVPFPTAHALWAGTLPTGVAEMRARLERFDAVLILGANPAIPYLYAQGAGIPPACQCFQISNNVRELGRVHAARLAVAGDIGASLGALLPRLVQSMAPRQVAVQAARRAHAHAHAERRVELGRLLAADLASGRLTARVAAAELVRAVGPETLLVDEAPVTMHHVRAHLQSSSARQYHSMRSAILGWGMPAAVGMSLGSGRRPVVSLLGDGSALYAPQAMWTAAHQQVPVTFVILNNRGYGILKSVARIMPGVGSDGAGALPGLDLVDPPIDFQALAAAFGLSARRVDRPGDVSSVLREGIASSRPNLVEILLAE